MTARRGYGTGPQARIRRYNAEIEQERRKLLANRIEAREAKAKIKSLERKIEREQKTNLFLRVGRWRIQRSMNAQDTAKVFIGFHLTAILAGAVLIFRPSPIKELGVSLVVGGLFAFGTLLSSIWSKVYDNERILENASPGGGHSRAYLDLEELARLLAANLEHREDSVSLPLSSDVDATSLDRN
jgi:hypothetical protein